MPFLTFYYCQGQSCAAGEGFTPLNTLIESLTIKIPDVSITTIKDLEYLNISDIVCNKFSIGDIEIGAQSPPSQKGLYEHRSH